MEFVLWFGIMVAAVALAGEHLFLVIFLACIGQFIASLVSVFASQRRHAVRWR